MKKKKEKIKNDYEGYSYGPLKLERSGRFIRMSSNWAAGDYEKHIAHVQQERPNLKKGIDKKISDMLVLINQYDPLEFLTVIATKNCFVNPEAYTESSHEGRECFVEFALSLILSQKRKKDLPHATKEAIDEFLKLVSEVMNGVLWYFGSEVAEGRRTKIEDEIRFSMMMQYLYVRGDSYPEHHAEMIKEVFQPHNDFFKQHYGFDCDEIISVLQRISDQPAVNLSEYVEVMGLMKEMHELLKKFIDAKIAEGFSSMDDIKTEYFTLPQVQEKKAKFDEKSYLMNKNVFEVEPSGDIPLRILDLISVQFGDNSRFVDVPEFNAWPTNESIINRCPLIKEDGKYYCFIPQMAFRQMSNILEQMIQDKNENYYQNTFLKKRSKYLEAKTLEYFSKLLPGARIFSNLYYTVMEDGNCKRVETDGLILYDQHLFIIESKAGKLSIASRRGGLMRLRKELKDVVEEGFQQAERTKRYIQETVVPVFENENGSEALRLEGKDQYKNVYLVNTTLQNFGLLTAHLPTIKDFGYVKGSEWPWNVFINDLRVISEILDFPTLFLLYLQRRIRANDYPQFHAHDELDFLIVYLKEGLYFENGKLGGITKYLLHGYTECLDRYYDFKAGRVSSGEKPTIKIDAEYKKLIREIESSRRYGFTNASITLLSFDIPTRKALIEGIKRCKALSVSDGKAYDFSMYFNADNMGFLCSVSCNRPSDFWENIDRHCRLKLYQTKFEEWVLLTIDYDKYDNRVFNFRGYREKWKYDAEMQSQLEIFKRLKLEQFRKTGNQIGRNDTCPCGSGIKYKRCCGR